MMSEIKEQEEALTTVAEKAEVIAVAAATAASFVENPGDAVMKARLFDEGLKSAEEFQDLNLRKFVQVMVSYQASMERTLAQMRIVTKEILLVSGLK